MGFACSSQNESSSAVMPEQESDALGDLTCFFTEKTDVEEPYVDIGIDAMDADGKVRFGDIKEASRPCLPPQEAASLGPSGWSSSLGSALGSTLVAWAFARQDCPLAFSTGARRR
jgi:hypothetical protein